MWQLVQEEQHQRSVDEVVLSTEGRGAGMGRRGAGTGGGTRALAITLRRVAPRVLRRAGPDLPRRLL